MDSTVIILLLTALATGCVAVYLMNKKSRGLSTAAPRYSIQASSLPPRRPPSSPDLPLQSNAAREFLGEASKVGMAKRNPHLRDGLIPLPNMDSPVIDQPQGGHELPMEYAFLDPLSTRITPNHGAQDLVAITLAQTGYETGTTNPCGLGFPGYFSSSDDSHQGPEIYRDYLKDIGDKESYLGPRTTTGSQSVDRSPIGNAPANFRIPYVPNSASLN